MDIIKAINRLNENEATFGLDVEPDETSLRYYPDEEEYEVGLWVYDTRKDNGEVTTGYAYQNEEGEDVTIVIKNGKNGDGRMFVYHIAADSVEEIDY